MFAVANVQPADSSGSSYTVLPEATTAQVHHASIPPTITSSPRDTPIQSEEQKQQHLLQNDDISDLVVSGKTLNSVSNQKPWVVGLTGIGEDSVSENIIVSNASVDLQHIRQQLGNNMSKICAAPAGICHFPAEEAASPSGGPSYSSVQVSCATMGCNYIGPLHHNCLQRWNSSCELRCRMLVTQASSLFGSNPDADELKALEHLALLYQCPQCGNSSLCQTGLNPFEILQDDPHASVLNAIQYVNMLSTCLDSRPKNAQCPDLVGRKITGNSPFLSGLSPNMQLSDVATDGYTHPDGRPGCHTGWSVPQSNQTQVHEQHSQFLRRFSLRRMESCSSTFSSGTSGLGSSIFTSNDSVEFSRRNSQNTDTASCCRTEDTFWSPVHSQPLNFMGKRNSQLLCPKSDELDTSAQAHCVNSGQQNFSLDQADNGFQQTESNSSFNDHATYGNRPNVMSTRSSHLSFWPREKQKSTSLSDGDEQKVVNRKGNIFQPRENFKIFEKLPDRKRKAYFIHMDDDSCTGNEDTRAFLLAQLTNHRLSSVNCLACSQSLPVYDHFPVIDGLFFISPLCHRLFNVSGLRITWYTHSITSIRQALAQPGANADPEQLLSNTHGQRLLAYSQPVVPPPGCLGPRQQMSTGHFSDSNLVNGSSSRYNYGNAARQERYLHALCMNCVNSKEMIEEELVTSGKLSRITCRFCGQFWTGSKLVMGGLYTYDIFAAVPCCLAHLSCKACGQYLDTDSSTTQRYPNTRIPQESLKLSHNSSDVDGPDKKDGSMAYPLPFYSQYSQLITCLFCQTVDYHFVKPFDQYYRIDLISCGRNSS